MSNEKRINPEGLAKLHEFPELEAYLPGLVQRIGADLPAGLGFALFLFDFGPNGRIAYASSAERADMVRTVKEWIAHEERRR